MTALRGQRAGQRLLAMRRLGLRLTYVSEGNQQLAYAHEE